MKSVDFQEQSSPSSCALSVVKGRGWLSFVLEEAPLGLPEGDRPCHKSFQSEAETPIGMADIPLRLEQSR